MFEKRLTRLNVFALLGVATLLAALNREHALIYGLFSIIAAAMLAGFIIPWWQLRGVDASVDLPPRDLVEGVSAPITIVVRNRGWFPRRYLKLHMEFAAGERATQVVEVLIVGVGARSESMHHGTMKFSTRGTYQAKAARLESTYPLGLISAKRAMQVAGQLIVVPKGFAIDRLHAHGAGNQAGLSQESRQPGDAGNFSGLREYVPGDAPRNVHWPTSARTGELHVIVFERVMRPAISVLLDTRATIQAGEGNEHTFEYAVRTAAALVEWAQAQAVDAQLVILGETPQIVWAEKGEGAQRLLRALAAVEADCKLELPELLTRARDRIPHDAHRLFLTPGIGRKVSDAVAIAALAGDDAPVTAVLMRRSSFAAESVDTAEAREAERLLVSTGIEVIPVDRTTGLRRAFA